MHATDLRQERVVRRWFATIGERAVTFIGYVGTLSLLLAQTVRWLGVGRVRWDRVTEQMELIAVQSLPIVTLISLFIGMVLAFQSAYQLRQFGGEIYIASLVALSIVREIGPVLTALIVAGRVGASIAAEIGTMKVTEQVDALETLAMDPVRYLVVPRFLALIVGLPLLTVYSDVIGITGGYLVGVFKLDISSQIYWRMTTTPLVLKDVTTGLIKSFIFAILICAVSCHEGFRTQGGAEGVGRATTLAVVLSFILVIASDCLFTAIFYSAWL